MSDQLTPAKLRELIAAATPGPWRMDQPAMGFSGFHHGEEPALFTAAPLQECPHGEQNHALILELVNNAPALADALEKARLLEWLTDECVDTIYMDDGRIIDVQSGDVAKALRAAKEAAK